MRVALRASWRVVVASRRVRRGVGVVASRGVASRCVVERGRGWSSSHRRRRWWSWLACVVASSSSSSRRVRGWSHRRGVA
ncbi:hypothetical protein ACXZ9C_10900 [Streptococcus agalactiae]